jgi:hypothetical protein
MRRGNKILGWLRLPASCSARRKISNWTAARRCCLASLPPAGGRSNQHRLRQWASLRCLGLVRRNLAGGIALDEAKFGVCLRPCRLCERTHISNGELWDSNIHLTRSGYFINRFWLSLRPIGSLYSESHAPTRCARFLRVCRPSPHPRSPHRRART